MNLAALVNRLQAWAQEELAAQGRLLELLKEQEEAIRKGSTQGVEQCGERMETELSGSAPRERRRVELMKACGRFLGVAPTSLTLSAVARGAEEAGVDAARLLAVRAELRTRAGQVVKAGRRIAAIARHHQKLLGDLMRILTAPQAETANVDGVLVDAEA